MVFLRRFIRITHSRRKIGGAPARSRSTGSPIARFRTRMTSQPHQPALYAASSAINPSQAERYGSVRRSGSVVERALGKGEVESSILSCGTILEFAEIRLMIIVNRIQLHAWGSTPYRSMNCLSKPLRASAKSYVEFLGPEHRRQTVFYNPQETKHHKVL